MKNPHLASVGTGKTQRGADNEILSSRNPCPYAHDCRRQWLYIVGTQTADCAHCYQNLSRTDMARIIAGRP